MFLFQIFATPETLIGYHPDAGASFYLSHLPGHIGNFSSVILYGYSLACAVAQIDPIMIAETSESK